MQIKLLALTTLFTVQAHAQLDLTFSLDSLLTNNKSVLPINITADKKFYKTSEKTFRANNFVMAIPNSAHSIAEKRILVSPKIVLLPKIDIQAVTPAKIIFDANPKFAPQPVHPLAQVAAPVIKPTLDTEEKLITIEPDEYKIIQGLIFFEIQKKYDVAMSLFSELSTSKHKTQALLHYAQSAYNLNLFTEYRQSIQRLLESTQDKSIRLKAVQSIAQNIKAMENSDMAKIDSLVRSFNIDTSKNDAYHYKQAKYFIKEKNLVAAENALSQISAKSEFYLDSVLLSTSINYRKGEVNTAIAKIEKVIPNIINDKKNKIRNMLILTLARLYFQKGKYKESYQNYLKVDRSSPLWIQSVIEQAWSQILVGDHIGAAGNMFSLHTEVFKKMYLPESYIVRSVGYLNLCQYGDALHVLTDLDSRFKKTHEKLVRFQSENQGTAPYYDLVKTWFSNSNQAEINSLPRSFVAELAIHPSFTNIQQRINEYDEEISKFNKIITDFSNRDQQLRQRITSNKNELQTLKNQQSSAQTLEKNDLKNAIYEMELQIVNRGKDGLKKNRSAAQARLDNEKNILRNSASHSLKKRYGELVTILEKLLEQEEVLAYEVYSGAGEHIRYQIAGGKIEDRAPAALTPEEKKSYKWKFRGEVWEDEIGHYRSSLKNVCARNDIAQKGDQ